MQRNVPHNREAEAAVLGSVMLRNESLDEVTSMISDADFYVPAHQAVFRAMVRIRDKGEPIDIVTLESSLRGIGELNIVGGIDGIGKLADRYASSHNVESYARLVRETASLRNLAIAACEISEDSRGDVSNVAEFIDDSERKILDVNQRGRVGGYERVSKLIHGVFEGITERAKLKNPITGTPTGYTGLDVLTGGLQPSDLVILAARPSMGKTALALNIAQNACVRKAMHTHLKGDEQPVLHPTLVFSLEMSAAQLIERVLCSEARVDASRLRSGRMIGPEFAEMVRAADRLNQSPLFIDDSASPSILEIRARARRFKQDRNIFPLGPDGKPKSHGLIIVDYLQLARGSKRGGYDIREQEISEISRGLKAVAKELHVPILALSQLNRGVDNRADHRPQLGDLRESGAIEQDADLVMFIYREERYQTDEEKRRAVEGQAEVIIGKQRNGPTGTVFLSFVGKYTRFETQAGREG